MKKGRAKVKINSIGSNAKEMKVHMMFIIMFIGIPVNGSLFKIITKFNQARAHAPAPICHLIPSAHQHLFGST